MPSVDLRPLFTPPDDDPQRSSDHSVTVENRSPAGPSSVLRKLRFSGPQLANFAFVSAACLGAAFCAAYLFKGDELFHEVAAWPRELFSGRPAVIAQRQADSGISDRVAAIPNPAGPAVNAASDSGDPFSSSRRLLGLDPPVPTIRRPGDGLSFSSPASTSPSANPIIPAGNSAVMPGPVGGVAGTSSGTSGIANGVSTAAESAVGSAAHTAARATSSASMRVARSPNRAGSLARNRTTRGMARAANTRAARMSPFQRAMATITKTLRGAKAGTSRAGAHARTNGRLARADRSRAANPYRVAQRQSRTAGRTSNANRLAMSKGSIKTGGSIGGSSQFGSRSAVTSRTNATFGSGGLSKGGASAMRTFSQTNFSDSAGGLKSLGSMGGGRGFGGGGMGLGGGRGFGRAGGRAR